MVFDGSDIAPLLQRWGELVESAPRELTSFLYTFAQRGTPPTVRLLNVYAGDDTEAAVDALRPLLEIGPLLDQQASLAPYAAIVSPLDNGHYGGQRRPLISNGFANRLTPELSEQLELGLRTRVASWISIRSAGGAVNDLDAVTGTSCARTSTASTPASRPTSGPSDCTTPSRVTRWPSSASSRHGTTPTTSSIGTSLSRTL
jgi:hypothetical protein